MTGFLDDLLAGKVEPSKPLWQDADAYLENGCVVNGSTVVSRYSAETAAFLLTMAAKVTCEAKGGSHPYMAVSVSEP